MLWFAMLDTERDMMLLLILLEVNRTAALPAPFLSKNILAGIIGFECPSAADIYQDTKLLGGIFGLGLHSCLVRTEGSWLVTVAFALRLKSSCVAKGFSVHATQELWCWYQAA
jgi:hypothetical protein